MTEMQDELKKIVDTAHSIVVIQADNPDGDSLGTALALENILGDMGKDVTLYCGVDIPEHLRYLDGWDRVVKELPHKFDASILVDANSLGLLETLDKSGQRGWVAGKPFIVLDHHTEAEGIPFATLTISQPVVATGELLYELATALDWPLNKTAAQMISVAIMADSLGLSTDATTARTIHIVAELVERGVSLAARDNARRLLMRRSPDLVHYKGQLLQRVEYHNDNRIAMITIPWGRN